MTLALHNLQNRFIASLLLKRRDPILSSYLLGDHFECYRRNLHGGLIKALAHTYPVCERLVGSKFFKAMAYHFVTMEISTGFSLNDYGALFPEFLANFPHVESLPYLSDVALLEWKIHQILIGPEKNCFSIDKLQQVPVKMQENIVFQLDKNTRLLESKFPVDKIWEQNQTVFEDTPSETGTETGMLDMTGKPDVMRDDIIDLSEGGCYLMLLRQGYDLRLDRLSHQEWTVLQAIEAGYSLKMLKSQLQVENLLKTEEIAIDTAELILKFIEKEYITDFVIVQAVPNSLDCPHALHCP